MEVKKMRACSACGGQKKQKCQICDGTGKVYMPIEEKEVPCSNPRCQGGYIACESCKGTGQESYIEIVPDPPKPEPPKQTPPPQPAASGSSSDMLGTVIGVVIAIAMGIFVLIAIRDVLPVIIVVLIICGVWKLFHRKS